MTEDHLIDQALAVLRQQLDDDHRLFVLIDPLLGDPWGKLVKGKAENDSRWTASVFSLYLHIEDPQRRLYLAALSEASSREERILTATVRIAVQEHLGLHGPTETPTRSVCGWLLCKRSSESNVEEIVAASITTLRNALATHAWVLPPKGRGDKHVQFRFFDPRINSHLSEILGTRWLDALSRMGVQSWWTMDEQGGLVCTGQASSETNGDTWRLGEAEWNALEQLSRCNQVMQLLPQWQLPEKPTSQAVKQAVARAFGWGWRGETDILRFVHCAVTLHPMFDEQSPFEPALRGLLEQGNPEGGFANAAHALITEWRKRATDSNRDGPASTYRTYTK